MRRIHASYKWDIDTIRNGYNEVKDKLKTCQNDFEREHLSNCLDYYETLFDSLYNINQITKKMSGRNVLNYRERTVSRNILVDIEFSVSKKYSYPMELIDLLLDVSEDLSCTLNSFDKCNLPKRSINTRDLFLLSISAIKEMFDYPLNKNVVKLINNIDGKFSLVNTRFLSRKYVSSNGFFSPDIYYKTPYLSVENNGSMDSVITMIHELGHADEYMMNNDYYINAPAANDLFSEVVSIFAQMLAYNYFIERSFCKNDFVLDNYNFISFMAACNHDLNKYLLYSGPGFKIPPFLFHKPLRYYVSFWVATQLYFQYLDDKALALNNLRNFIMHDKTDDFSAVVESTGIDINDTSYFVKKYVDRLKRVR